nr:uncharacterized protein LOC124818185 [Hydra vulgaris]
MFTYFSLKDIFVRLLSQKPLAIQRRLNFITHNTEKAEKPIKTIVVEDSEEIVNTKKSYIVDDTEDNQTSCYLQQRYGVSEKFEILTLPHAIQAEGITFGVFCLKFAESYTNGEVLVRVFPHEEVNAYRKRDKGDQM